MSRVTKPIEHGTMKGYGAHQRHRDLYGPPCADCKAALAKNQAEYRKNRPRVDRTADAERRRIRDKALAQLAETHKREFDALMAKVEQELKESAS